jgi:hypothetical protein
MEYISALNSSPVYANGLSIFTLHSGTAAVFTAGVNTYPIDYRLYQNSPIIFDSKTRIGFDIPKYTRVKLAIYDIFGREVETVIDEELNTGCYEIEWNARNFPVGVYIYKLMTKEFVDTKKMFLLKEEF